MTYPRYILFALLLAALVSYSSTFAAQDSQIKIYTTLDGLAGDFVTAVAFEPNGSAWVGTSQGVTHLEPDRWTSYTRVHGLGDSWITAIAVAPDGRVWFGTKSGGLSVLDPRAKIIKTYDLDNSAIPSDFVTALAVDAANRLWIGTLNRGVAQFDPGKNRWMLPAPPDEEITSITLDENGAPWVGTAHGVFHWNGAEWRQDQAVGRVRVQRLDAFDGRWYLTTPGGRFVLTDGGWSSNTPGDEINTALVSARLDAGQITAFARDAQQRFWLGTPRGLWLLHRGDALLPPPPLPVVLIHGWTVAADDTLETSEFRFLANYADRDGIPMYYARGVTPKNTLYQNAMVIRDEIARVKQETGARQVNLVGFSMGGMNARAYLETSAYGNDVNRAIILGTPQAGVEVWKPILVQELLQKPDEPSAIELSPEYATLVNATRLPNPTVPYDLLIGDARNQAGLDFLKDLPAGDALISVHSALALDAPTVHKHINSDLHDWSPQAVPLDLTAYLYPRDTWERYLRNALRNRENAPLGSEITEINTVPAAGTGKLAGYGDHTPVVTGPLGPGETITRTVLLDKNQSARFVAYYPGGQVDVSLVAPNGKRYAPSVLPRADKVGVLSLSTDVANFSGYVIQNAPVGAWQIVLARKDGNEAPLAVSTYVELDSQRQLKAQVDVEWEAVNTRRQISASLTQGTPAFAMTARIAIPSSKPGGPFTFTTVPFSGPNADGVFIATYTPPQAGWYALFVQAGGKDFARETELLFAAGPAAAQFEPGAAVQVVKGATLPLALDFGVRAKQSGHYAVVGELHRVRDDQVVARSFTLVDLEPGENRVRLAFDTALPHDSYSLNLQLLDTNWAALEVESAAHEITFTF